MLRRVSSETPGCISDISIHRSYSSFPHCASGRLLSSASAKRPLQQSTIATWRWNAESKSPALMPKSLSRSTHVAKLLTSETVAMYISTGNEDGVVASPSWWSGSDS